MANTFYTLQSGLMFHIFGGVSHPRPSSLAICLAGPVPTNRSVVEVPNQSGYARVTVAPGSANWSYEPDGKMYNKNQISFPVCSGYVGWTSGVFITDNATYGAGNILFFNQHPISAELGTNSQVTYAVSGLAITLT